MSRSRKRPESEKKLWPRILLVVLALLLVLAFFIFLVFHRYYKMLTPDETFPSEPESQTEEFIDPDEDPLPEGETNSPQEEIEELESQAEENADSIVEPYYDKDVMNILLIGSDARSVSERGRSDSMILVSVNKRTQQIVMTSLLRDIYVSIPGRGHNRLNAAYSFGGAPLLTATLQANFGIRVDHYVKVNFQAFTKVIDTVGGVSIPITAAEAEYMRAFHKDIPAGDQTLLMDGDKALTYARARHLKGADFGRTERQRKVLSALLQTARGLSLPQLDSLLRVLLPALSTDMSEWDLITLTASAPSILRYDLVTFRVPADGTYRNMNISGRAVLGIDFRRNRALLMQRIYGD